MSYTKTNWHDGDTITAVKMNKIENGIESSLSDALVTLGKALCGDSFEVESGLTDAETILEIAKNYTGGSGSGDKSRIEIRVNMVGGNVDPLPTGLEYSDFIDSIVVILNEETVVACLPTMGIINSLNQGFITILAPNILSSLEAYAPPISLKYYPATGEVVTGQDA